LLNKKPAQGGFWLISVYDCGMEFIDYQIAKLALFFVAAFFYGFIREWNQRK
jgi:hypothetical protein